LGVKLVEQRPVDDPFVTVTATLTLYPGVAPEM
jgi:hypothetical protein